MPKFSNWNAYQSFEKKVLNRNRYIFDAETQNFLNILLDTAKERVKGIKKDSILWRSQVGHDFKPIEVEDKEEIEIPAPFLPKRMYPFKSKASEGRVNPKGIPALYLSTDHKTSMAELRPWKHSLISVGEFKINRNLKVIDCSKHHEKPIYYLDPPEDKETINNAVWSHVDHAFSIPVQRDEYEASYAPTQIISELFKDEGYDGILYKSHLGEGHNIALFDIDDATIIRCNLYLLEDINYEFEFIGETYQARKKEK